jgi:hypothetical protein
MTYNAFLIFNKMQTRNADAEWIVAQNADVLALRKLKVFDQKRIDDAAIKRGHRHAVIFDRKGGFPQGRLAFNISDQNTRGVAGNGLRMGVKDIQSTGRTG